MPQLANDLLVGKFDSDPVGLYRALQKKGNRDATNTAGGGGLGRHFNNVLTRQALDIKTTPEKKVSMKALAIDKLWQLCEAFKHGDPDGGKAFSVNKNKHIICLIFLIKQPTVTLHIAGFQERAFVDLKDYYHNVTGFAGQLLYKSSQSGLTVEDKILELEEAFLKRKKSLERSPEPGLPSQTIVNSTSYPSGFRQEPSQSQSTISLTTLMPRPPQQLIRAPEEEKREDMNTARTGVDQFLNQMIDLTTPQDGQVFKLSDVKIAQKVFFLVKVPDLTLLQLSVLCSMMKDIQSFPKHEEKRFYGVRRETGFWYRFFYGPYGNTKTWQNMAEKVQTVMLKKLTEQEFAVSHPREELSEFDFTRVDVEKIELDPRKFRFYFGLFNHSFGRGTGAPEVLKIFNNRFVEFGSSRSPRP